MTLFYFLFQMDHHFLAGEYQNVEVFSDDQYECMAKVDFSVLSYLVKECGVGDARKTDFLSSHFDRCDLGFFQSVYNSYRLRGGDAEPWEIARGLGVFW